MPFKFPSKPVLIAVVAAGGIAVLGGLMTDIGPWYLSLAKPSWKPPDWLFGPVWTLIFALTALSGLIGWKHAPTRARRDTVLALLACNAFLNVLWTLFFFGMKRPDWSLIEVPFLWLSVLAIAICVWPIRRRAAWFLAPYLVWVAFAGVLNLSIVRLNAPFA